MNEIFAEASIGLPLFFLCECGNMYVWKGEGNMKRVKVMSNKTVVNIAIGLAVGLLAVLVGGLAGAYLISSETVGFETLNYISVVVLLCAAFFAALAGGKGTAGKERLLTGMITGGGLWLVLLCINLLMFDNGISGVWVTAVLMLAGSMAAFLLFGKSGSKKKYRIPKF